MTDTPAPAPPINLEFEQCLLRALLKGARCPDFLGAQHFADPIHGLIYSTIERLQDGPLPVRFASIAAHFERTGELAEVGGAPYLSHLIHGARPTLTSKEYARGIHDLWVERLQLDSLMALSRPPPNAGAQETLQ